MAILVLFEQSSRKFCLNLLALILSALPNMMHFGHELYKNHQKSLAYFSHLSPLFLFVFTKYGVKTGALNNAPLNTSHSVAKCSGLGHAWDARHCWTRFLSSTSPLFKSKLLCRKIFKTATLNQKRNQNVRSKFSWPVFIATCWD